MGEDLTSARKKYCGSPDREEAYVALGHEENAEHFRNNQVAWVVFSGQTELPWVKLLKPGFRHCYIVIHDGAHWVSLDPLASHAELTVHNLPAEFDLPAWLAEQGHRIIPANIERVKCIAPWAIMNCVEVVKRMLGIHKRMLVTPWQLYNHLAKQSNITAFNNPPKGDTSWEASAHRLKPRSQQ